MAPEQPKTNKATPVKDWFGTRYSEALLVSKTAITLILIVDSMALGLAALGFVKPNPTTYAVLGSIAIAFAAVVLGTFVHQGVKFQTVNKRKR